MRWRPDSAKQAAANAIRRIEARIAVAEASESDDPTPEYRDVFICHAREDRERVVDPIAEALARVGVSCWLDQAEIRWGDSVTGEVNEGPSILLCPRNVVSGFPSE